MLLPPIGAPIDAGEICAAIMLLKEEARLVRDPYEQWADLSSSYFHYGAAQAPADGSIIIQDIQNSVITQTDVQTKEPPTITLEPVDTEEPPIYFCTLDPATATRVGLQPQEFQAGTDPTGQPLPQQPLSPQSTFALQQLIAQQQLPPSALIEIGISNITDFYQKIFNVIWQRSNPEAWYYENTLWNNVYGWVTTLYEFDDANKKHIFTNKSLRQVFADPTNSDIDKSAYLILDLDYDAEVAKALHPEWADDIEQYADPAGKITRPPNTLEMGSQVEDVASFNRPMVTLTVAFLRDQPVLMPAEEAVAAGKLNKQSVPTGNWTHQRDADNPDQLNIVEETRDQLTHPTTGAEVHPPGHDDFDHTQWPTTRATRQITLIATKSIVLDDTASNYGVDGIPAALNVNIPILGKPYGIGEPFRLSGMQDGRTRIINATVEHAEYFRSPITEIPIEARQELPEEYQDGHAHPGMVVWARGDLLAKCPNGIARYLTPPPLPPALMDIDDKLKREINDSNGNMASIQGQAPEQQSQLSGVAIGLIQNGAASMASFKAKKAQQMIARIAKLCFHSILTRMTPADFGQIIKKYPPSVLEYMHGQAQSLEWTVNVTVAAGAGTMLAQKKQEAVSNFKNQLQSRKTTQEVIGVDPSQEDQRMQSEAAEQARIQMQNQPPAQAQSAGRTPQPAGNSG